MTKLERVTAAIKAEIGRQLDAQPLHGSATDWYTNQDEWQPTGGSLDLVAIAKVAMAAQEDAGLVIVPREPELHPIIPGYGVVSHELWRARIAAVNNKCEGLEVVAAPPLERP